MGAAVSVIENAVINSVSLGLERGCFLDSCIYLDLEIGSQGFGGWALGGADGAKCSDHTNQPNLAAEWIVSVLRAADVESWDQLRGKAIRVERSESGFGGKITGIGHITKNDRWFRPSERFKEMLGNKE